MLLYDLNITMCWVEQRRHNDTNTPPCRSCPYRGHGALQRLFIIMYLLSSLITGQNIWGLITVGCEGRRRRQSLRRKTDIVPNHGWPKIGIYKSRSYEYSRANCSYIDDHLGHHYSCIHTIFIHVLVMIWQWFMAILNLWGKDDGSPQSPTVYYVLSYNNYITLTQ